MTELFFLVILIFMLMTTNVYATDFINNVISLNCIQYVCGPTHNQGHTLDLVFTLGVEISTVNCLEMTQNSIFDAYQSGFRVNHSTETALEL